jgi:hypothetical protein
MSISILIMNEDSAPGAYTALTSIIRRICQLIQPGIPTQRLQFTPTPVEHERCVRANQWKSTNPRDYRRQTDLAQVIAAQLATDTGFVAFHYDGDCAWQNSDDCPHDSVFETNVREPVKLLLANHVSDDQIDDRLSKLLVLKPFYCLEAWTYQNLTKARSLCAALGNPSGTRQLDQWDADPGQLDEILQLPDKFPLGKDYNAELTAQAYPAESVYYLRKSFAASVDAAMACQPFTAALAQLLTIPPGTPPPPA